MRIQKYFIPIALLTLLAVPFLAEAQGILPQANPQCIVTDEQGKPVTPEHDVVKAVRDKQSFVAYVNGDKAKLQAALGCAIKTGRIGLFMMPYFVTYLIQFLLQIAGLIAVLFVVYGGFQYVKGGVSEDKDSGKKTLTHALVGLVVSVSAWIIVNFIQVALTS